MPKANQQPGFFTQFTHGIVRFLAFSSLIPRSLADSKPEPQDYSSDSMIYGQLFDARSYTPNLSLDTLPDQALFDISKKLLVDSESKLEELNVERAISILHHVNQKYTMQYQDKVLGRERVVMAIPRLGLVHPFSSKEERIHAVDELTILAVAELIGSNTRAYIDDNAPYIAYELNYKPDPNHIKTKHSTFVEKYFQNYLWYVIQKEYLRRNQNHDIKMLGEACLNMLQMHDALKTVAPSPSHLQNGYKILNLAKRIIDKFLKNQLHRIPADPNEESSDLFVRENQAEYLELYANHQAGVIGSKEFLEIEAELDESNEDPAGIILCAYQNLLSILSKPLGSIELTSVLMTLVLLQSAYRRFGHEARVVRAIMLVNELQERALIQADAMEQKKKAPKVKKQIEIDPQQVKAEEEKRQESINKYLEEQNQLKEARDKAQEKRALERKNAKASQEKRDKLLERVFNDVYSTLSGLTSNLGSVKSVFSGPNLRKLTLEKILESGLGYYVDGTNEIDQKNLAKDILAKIGLDKGAPIFEDLNRQFAEIFDKGPDAVRLEQAQAAARAEKLAQDEEARRQEAEDHAEMERERNRIERMNINKEIYDAERLNAKKTIHSSSSSSSSVPLIGFASKEEADSMKNLIIQLGEVLKNTDLQGTLSNDLFVLKHDLIQISAAFERIVKAGGSAIVKAMLNYQHLMIMRNGALHLLEIDADTESQISFYQSVLKELRKLSSLDINLASLAKGLNHFLNDIKTKQSPVEFSEQANHFIFQSFQADCLVWRGEPENKSRSDVHEALEERHHALRATAQSDQKRLTMITAEIAELYSQLKNAGCEIPTHAHRLINSRNLFAHEGKEIELDVIRRYLTTFRL
jgi:hypothetical protein